MFSIHKKMNNSQLVEIRNTFKKEIDTIHAMISLNMKESRNGIFGSLEFKPN